LGVQQHLLLWKRKQFFEEGNPSSNLVCLLDREFKTVVPDPRLIEQVLKQPLVLLGTSG